ncbi:MAG: hypothetical protein WCO84_09885 [bacterium]
MILRRTDLHKFVPVTDTGEVLGTAFEVDTETKVAKCRGVLTADQRGALMMTIPGHPAHPRMMTGHDFTKIYFAKMYALEKQQPSYERAFDHLEPIEEVFPWWSVGGSTDLGYDGLQAMDSEGNRHQDVFSIDPATKTGTKWDPFKEYKAATTVEEGFILDQKVRDLKPVPFKYDHLVRFARGVPS